MSLPRFDMSEPVFAPTPLSSRFYWTLAPDADSVMTLWRGLEPHDDSPIPEADERTTHPALWAFLAARVDELNGAGRCPCSMRGCSDGAR